MVYDRGIVISVYSMCVTNGSSNEFRCQGSFLVVQNLEMFDLSDRTRASTTIDNILVEAKVAQDCSMSQMN